MGANNKGLTVVVPYTRSRSHAYMVWHDPATGRYPWKVWRHKPGPKREVAHGFTNPPPTRQNAVDQALEAIRNN